MSSSATITQPTSSSAELGAAGAEREDHGGEHELDRGDEREQAAAERQRLHRLGLDHAPEQLADSFAPHLLGRQPQGADEQPTLEQRAATERERALQPGHEQLQRHQREQQQRPGEQPAAVEPAGERRLAHHPPGEQEEQVLQRVRGDEAAQPRGEAGAAELAGERALRPRPQQPAAGERLRAEPLREQRVACALAAARRQVGFSEQPVDFRQQRRRERCAKTRRERRRRQPPHAEVGSDDGDSAARAAEQREEARLARDRHSQQRGAGVRRQALGLRIRALHCLDLQAGAACQAREPRAERVVGGGCGG